MSIWENRDIAPESKISQHKSGNTVYDNSKPGSAGFKAHNTNKVPAELLILGRFGISYKYLTTALRLSEKYKLHPGEILIRGKVITFETWVKAQDLLKQEIEEKFRKKNERETLLWNAINFLKYNMPEYSAVTSFEWKQIIFLLAMCFFFIFTIMSADPLWLTGLLLAFTIFYTLGVLFRGILLAAYENRTANTSNIAIADENSLPNYSVLVALYKESNQIVSLTNSLSRLDWPKHLLDIKLICEEDDTETIETIQNAGLPEYFQLVIVPSHHPRTKPKALNYALPMCKSQYLVLYDAEDIPSPGQLREAHLQFSKSDEKLACLQAPLLIHNADQNWLTRMFAIEYDTLFTGILPVLSKWHAPLPLGGTSNHFKLSVLKEIGGWDPYNVTEDADLGIRLFRNGYRCETITLPTYEESPPLFTAWLRQRTRWIKGWMQTLLVHNRQPIKLASELGTRNIFTFHLFLTSIVISALIHPIFIGFSLIQILNVHAYTTNSYELVIIMTSVFNLVGGYTTYGLMAYAVLQSTNNNKLSKWLITLPAYWLLISIAAWRALFYLFFKPHLWEKTPHGLANSRLDNHNFTEFDT